MPRNLGQLFYDAAHAPLSAALAHLNGGQVVRGLHGLRGKTLEEGWGNGVELVALHVGVKEAEVVEVLGDESVHELFVQLDPILGTLNRFSDQLGRSLSLAPGVSPTQSHEGIAEALQALAVRYQLDKELSEPLTLLADMMAQVQASIDRARDTLGGDKKLQARVRRRLLVRVVVGATVLGTIAGAGGWYAWTVHTEKAARARVQAVIDEQDPCRVEQIRDADRAYATPTQRANIKQHLEQCNVERAKQMYLHRCANLAKHVKAGHLDSTDREQSGKVASLFERVTNHDLSMDDLQLEANIMPCQDTPSGAALWDAVAVELGRSANLWGQATSASAQVRKLLLAVPGRWTERSRKSLVFHAESLAKRAVKTGRDADMKKANKVCALLQQLRGPEGRNCRALKNVQK